MSTVSVAVCPMNVSEVVAWRIEIVVARGVSTATTAGFANPVVSTVEFGSSVATSLLTVFLPVVAFGLVLAVLAWMLRGKRKPAEEQPPIASSPAT